MEFILIIVFSIGLFWFFNKYHGFNYDYSWTSTGRKELKIWISAKLYNFLNGLLAILHFLIVFIYIELLNRNWLSAFLLFMIFMLSVSWMMIKSNYKINKNWTIESVQNIDKDGFEIQLIRNGKLQSTQKIQWKLIKRLSVKSDLKIYYENNERIIINSFTEYYHKLLKSLPEYFPKITNQQINLHFKDLKPCLVCGSIARIIRNVRLVELILGEKNLGRIIRIN